MIRNKIVSLNKETMFLGYDANTLLYACLSKITQEL